MLTKGHYSGPPDRPDLMTRLLAALEAIGQRLPSRVVRIIERRPPRIELVPLLEDAIGTCCSSTGVIQLSIPALDLLSDVALAGLVCHEVMHWYRWLMGHDKTDQLLEEVMCNEHMRKLGFGAERDALDAEKTTEFLEALVRAERANGGRTRDDFFPPAPVRRYRE